MLRFVPTPIGNIADITPRALEALERADIFLCEDTRVTKQLLHILEERYNLQTKETKRFYPLHSHNEEAFLAKLHKEFFDNEVVYLSDAGMPAISDPGAALVAYAQKNGIEYEVLPGANALLTAYAASGFTSNRFLFFGFLPHKGKERESALEEALYSGYVTILYEAPHRLLKLLEALAKREPQREIFLAKELTKKYQKFYKAKAKDLPPLVGTNIKGEWVVVIDAEENGTKNTSAVTQEDILSLDIPKKQQAKLLAKITGKSIKECYNELL